MQKNSQCKGSLIRKQEQTYISYERLHALAYTLIIGYTSKTLHGLALTLELL